MHFGAVDDSTSRPLGLEPLKQRRQARARASSAQRPSTRANLRHFVCGQSRTRAQSSRLEKQGGGTRPGSKRALCHRISHTVTPSTLFLFFGKAFIEALRVPRSHGAFSLLRNKGREADAVCAQKLMIIRHDAQFRSVCGRLFSLRVLSDQGRRGDASGTSLEVQLAAGTDDIAGAALGASTTSLAAKATQIGCRLGELHLHTR